MPEKINLHAKKISAVLGIVAVSALPPWHFLPALFISFSGLLLLLQKASSFKKSFAVGYWFGFGFFACGFSWIGNALLIDAASFGWLYPLALLAGGAFFGLFAAVPSGLSFFFRGITGKYAAFPALWALSEWLRSFILTGFPWNLLGSCLAFHPAGIQLASVFGTYGLSWLLIIIAAAPALWIAEKKQKKLLAATVIIVAGIGGIFLFGNRRLAAYDNTLPSNTTIRIVQPNIPQSMKWNRKTLENNFRDYIELSRSPGLEKIDFVVWGETASPFPLDIDSIHRTAALAAVPPHGYLVAGALRYHFDAYGKPSPLNSVLILQKDGNIAASYDKTHLVPFGEYLPLKKYLPDSFRPIANAVADFGKGQGPETINLPDYPSLGTVICYEIIFPHKIINPENKPDWIINVTNDGWYGDSAGPRQHLVAAQLRAVEEGITVLRAANTGISALISPAGKILGRLELNQRGILDIRLPQTLNLCTIYGKLGNTPLFILLIVNIILAIVMSKYNQK